MSTPQVDPRVPASSPSRVPTMRETPFSNSMATIGKEEPSKSERTGTQTLAAGSKAAKAVSAEDLVQEVATVAVVTVPEEDLADEEAVLVAEAAMVEDSAEVEVDSRLAVVGGLVVNKVEATEVHPKRLPLLTPSPTLLPVVVSVVK